VHSSATETIEIDRLALQRRLQEMPRLPLAHDPTPVQEMPRLRGALGGGPRLLVKRDDAIPFACGGNKVRKLEMVLAKAIEEGADTLITTGGVQSNHARVTAAAAARVGMRCVLVLNGADADARPTGNARLMALYGARIEYVSSRQERTSRMQEIAHELQGAGRHPFIVPLGASTPLGTLGFARAMGELTAQVDAPAAIVLASSSGGTQAGLAGGCTLFDVPTRVIGVSADDPAEEIERATTELLLKSYQLLGATGTFAQLVRPIEVDDCFVGAGYGVQTAVSREAALLAARTEGLILDPVYTAKAMACLIAYVREGRFSADETILFWHTGGIPGFFA
jgi:1-aminocyclopropane-1-carboxylate deaminase/D-cysteine desulfhydrase-like pyridoxal-dependent ACC family enzyme